MKTLIEYLNETLKEDKASLIDYITNLINSSDEESFKKIKKSINQYGLNTNIINDWLINHAGINSANTNTIIQKIKSYDMLSEMIQIISDLSVTSLKNKNLFTTKKLLDNCNIFNLIKEYCDSVIPDISKDKDFNELLIDIANFDKGGKVIAGKFEHLTSIFLYDLNDKNNKLPGKTVCDINTKEYGLEYKITGARIGGNTNVSKPLSAEVITEKCKELTIKYIEDNLNKKETDTEKNRNSQYSSGIRSNDNLDKELDDAEKDNNISIKETINKIKELQDIFKSKSDIKNYIDLCESIQISSDIINDIIISSYCAQVPSIDISEKDKNNLIELFAPIYGKDKKFDNAGKNNSSMRRIQQLWLLLNLYNYHKAEDFDYLVVFDSNINGDYKCINFTDIDSLFTLYDNIKNEIYNDANPSYTGKSNSQNSLPMVKLIKLSDVNK